MHETRTAGLAAQRLEAAGYEVAPGVGKTGVVGLLRNGEGPTVMLRADMDAQPVKEATGLPYASSVTTTSDTGESTPVMHACGHDMHVAWLVGAATLLARHRDEWKSTLMPVFQPGGDSLNPDSIPHPLPPDFTGNAGGGFGQFDSKEQWT